MYLVLIFKCKCGTSLVVQWLRLLVSTVGGEGGLIPGQRMKIMHAKRRVQKEKKKKKK